MFRVGQKVVCVHHGKYMINDRGLPSFEYGQVYTVASIEEHELYGMFISAVELHPDSLGHVRGFRPVVERKTDISIFKRMLTPQKDDAHA